MIAVVRPSRTSTSGRDSDGIKPCTKALYVSLISRWDSAAIVPNTSELLPEPDTPVNTVSRRFGIAMLMSLRLFTRAPCTRIRSWLSAACSPDDCGPVVVAVIVVVLMVVSTPIVSRLMVLAALLNADHAAGWIADGAVPHAVWLLGRLLDDLGVARLQFGEDAVEV